MPPSHPGAPKAGHETGANHDQPARRRLRVAHRSTSIAPCHQDHPCEPPSRNPPDMTDGAIQRSPTEVQPRQMPPALLYGSSRSKPRSSDGPRPNSEIASRHAGATAGAPRTHPIFALITADLGARLLNQADVGPPQRDFGRRWFSVPRRTTPVRQELDELDSSRPRDTRSRHGGGLMSGPLQRHGSLSRGTR